MDLSIILTLIGIAMAIVGIIFALLVPFLVHIIRKIDQCATKEELGAIKTDLSTLSKKVDNCAKAQDLSNLTGNVIEISRCLGVIQGQLMPKVVPFQEEKPKKKAKGE